MAADNKKIGNIMKKILIVVLIVVVLGGLGFFGFTVIQENGDLKAQLKRANDEIQTYKTNPQEAAQAEVKRYVEEVGKLYALPADEQPSVATVSDKSKLKNEAFFASAENGDITLIYPNAKLAILYRPSTKQIVNVSSVTIQQKND